MPLWMLVVNAFFKYKSIAFRRVLLECGVVTVLFYIMANVLVKGHPSRSKKWSGKEATHRFVASSPPSQGENRSVDPHGVPGQPSA
jgi:hypothetical protein